jgi:hypothetical protein
MISLESRMKYALHSVSWMFPVMDIEDVCRDNGERVQAHKEEITCDVPTGWTVGLVDNPNKIVGVI